MTGTTSMMLGDFAFEALGFGYQGIKAKVNTPWSESAVGQTLNPLQWTGPTSEEATINGVLFPEEFGGLSQLDGLKAAALAGEELMLVSGDAAEGVISGIFTIQSIEEDRSYIDHRGQPRRDAYVIALKRPRSDTTASAGGLVERATTFLSNLFGG